MHYNCNDIRKLLDSDPEIGLDIEAFEIHVDSCPDCQRLLNLNPAMNESLQNALPTAAPDCIYENIAAAIKAEVINRRAARLAKSLRYSIPLAAYILFAVLIYLNEHWLGDLARLSRFRLNFDGVVTWLNSLIPANYNMITDFIKMAVSPLLLAASVGIAVLIWYYSLSKIEKIIK